jgi:hypothetical protein
MITEKILNTEKSIGSNNGTQKNGTPISKNSFII